MDPIRRAVIDVGTNSVKLLVGQVHGSQVLPLVEKSDQTRLGKGFYPDHKLQTDAVARTAEAVARFAAEAAAWNPERIRVIGTSAARDAVNRLDLIHAIQSAAGLQLEVISGNEEAEWVYAGVRTDPRFFGVPLLIIDLGGGSTELILGKDAAPWFRQSVALGTVRLLERLGVGDPPRQSEHQAAQNLIREFLEREIGPVLVPALQRVHGQPVRLIGTGGTTTILAGMKLRLREFNREQLESVALSFAEVEAWEQQLWRLPLAERRTLPGLPPNRADVILMGAAIFAGIMRQFRFAELHPTTRGLRFAALLAED